jgi:membrane fusion protein (multidrug efflux system)
MKTKYILYAVIVIIIGYLAYTSLNGKKSVAGPTASPPRAPIPVDVIVATPAPFPERITIKGSIVANEEVMLKSEVPGKVVQIFFNEGQRVRKGTLLVKMYDEDLQAGLAKAVIKEKNLSDKELRQRTLLAKESISQQEYDDVSADLGTARAEIEQLKAQISKTEVKAPFDGTLGLRKISPGDVINTGTEIASLVNSDPAKVVFSIPEKYAASLPLHSMVSFKMSGSVDVHQARIFAREPRIDESTRSLQLKAQLPNPRGLFIPGSYVEVDLVLDAIQDAILIPTDAISLEAEGARIYKYRSGLPIPEFIETGTRTNTHIHVLKGVAPGDTIITSGILQITPRSKVTISKILK